MARPPRISPPSAIDGYRRLERTRRTAGTAAPTEPPGIELEPRRARPGRVAGALRLVGFLAVIAVIVGTSVGLASADPREKPSEVSTPTAVAAANVASEDESPSEAAAEDVSASAVKAPVVVADAVAAPDVVVAAAPRPTSRELPFTGEASLDHVLLGGAGLVLLGMLVQIAGQPLPARAHARART